jgi:hypothetical protein
VGCRAGITAKAISKFVSIPEALVGICEIVHAVENTTIFCEYLLQQLHLSVGQHKDSHSVILGDPNGAIRYCSNANKPHFARRTETGQKLSAGIGFILNKCQRKSSY